MALADSRTGRKTIAGKSLRRRLPGLLGGGFLLLVMIGLVYLIRDLIVNSEPSRKRAVQEISLIKPPPPKVEEKPPEPQKPEEKPPEIKEEVKLDEPEAPKDVKDEPPAGPDLALDADGTSGSDGFGLGAKKGGRELTSIGGSRFGGYLGTLQQNIRDALNQDDKVRKAGEYKITLKLWIAKNGSVDRLELLDSTGNLDVDAAMKRVLAGITLLKDPPEDMPQPVKIRISAR